MSRHLLPAAALCVATLLAAVPPAASAVDAAVAAKPPTSPDQPDARTGRYKTVKRGPRLTHAKCAEGGNVFVPTHERATPTQKDRDVRDACKNIDYTK